MIDTYKDTTGSRKKFLIPLVVLLLCAVSLTGAGYAYNASVTVNNAGTPVLDEYFTVNIFEQDTTVIKDKINPSEEVDGLVFVTSKVMNNSASPSEVTLKGVFDKEKRDIVIYTGAIKVVADNLSRDTNPYAGDDETSTVNAVLSSGEADTDCKAKVVDATTHQTVVATLTGVTVKFYSNAACTQALENNKATIGGDFVYYQVIATGISGAEEISAAPYAVGDEKTYKPDVFAADVVDDYVVLFDFKIVATAEELDA